MHWNRDSTVSWNDHYWIEILDLFFSKLVLENTFNSIEKCNRCSELRPHTAAYLKFQWLKEYVHDSWSYNDKQVAPIFELGSLDSESRVPTITLCNRSVCLSYSRVSYALKARYRWKLGNWTVPPIFEFGFDDFQVMKNWCCIGGIVVSIATFQAVDPYSIPGQCIEFVIRLADGMPTIELKYWIYFSVKLVLENTFNSIEKCKRRSELRTDTAAYLKFQWLKDYGHDSWSYTL